MKKFISVFNFTILVVLVLSIPLLYKAEADWNSYELSRIRVSTAAGLDSLPSEKATSSGTSINYTIDAFGIGYTTSTLTIDDSEVKKSSTVLDLSVMTGIQRFTFQTGYGWLLSHKWDHPSYDYTTNSSEGGSGFFNVGLHLGLFEVTGGYRVWSIIHNVNKSYIKPNGKTQTSDDKDHLAYKEMYLGLGYIF